MACKKPIHRRKRSYNFGSGNLAELVTAFGGWKLFVVIPLALLLFIGGTAIFFKIWSVLSSPVLGYNVPVWAIGAVIIMFFMWKGRRR